MAKSTGYIIGRALGSAPRFVWVLIAVGAVAVGYRWSVALDEDAIEQARIISTQPTPVNPHAAKIAAAAEQARIDRGPTIGMTVGDVLKTKWGKPESINRTQSSAGTSEQWVYGNGNYLYFRNDVLQSISTRN
jgi:hypothetical protein